MRQVVALGVGMHQFGRFPEKSYPEMGRDAVLEALKDAGLEWRDIPVVYASNSQLDSVAGELVECQLGAIGLPIVNIGNACAGGNTAVMVAQQAVAAGLWDMALVLGIEKMPRGPAMNAVPVTERLLGVDNMTTKYAMKMQRAIYEHLFTLDQMAMVSVKAHKNGNMNPYAQYKIHCTVQDVHNSRMISDPLTLYHCCPTGDGAAAVIICTRAIARKYTTGPFIEIAGGALGSLVFERGETNDTREVSARVAKQAYESTGCGPSDFGVIELHDNFTISELEHYEDLGLCGIGEGGRLIEDGVTEISGRQPVNPSGGLIARGHPVGATGVAQVVELVWQMRGQAGERQVKDPKAALAHCCGGNQGMVCCVNILKK